MISDDEYIWQILDLYNSFEFYDIQRLPVIYQNLILNKNRNHHERFKLWNFLWSNGLDPIRCSAIILLGNEHKGEAKRSCREWELWATTEHNLHKLTKYKSYSMELYKVI